MSLPLTTRSTVKPVLVLFATHCCDGSVPSGKEIVWFADGQITRILVAFKK